MGLSLVESGLLKGRAHIGLLLIGCLLIGLGAALSTADLYLPSSHIAALKLMGCSLFQVTIYGML
jgi:hypothetical protein